jgi:hypothetical protein
MNRKDFRAIGWQKVSEKALNQAIELNVPENIFKVIAGKSRETDIKRWRNVIMMCHWLNGECLAHSARTMNRHHSTLLHAMKSVKDEIDGFIDEHYVERLRVINYYALNRVPTEMDKYINLEDVTVIYKEENDGTIELIEVKWNDEDIINKIKKFVIK